MASGMRLVGFVVSLVALLLVAACGAAPDDATQPVQDDALAGDSCSHGYYTKPAADGIYYATDFGCSLKADGTKFRDPGDNCIPGCLAQAQQSICAGKSGP